MGYAGADLILRGTTDTIKLRAPQAETALVTPGAQGVTWVASGFKYVTLGTAGTDTLSFTADIAGNYRVRIFGQNLTGAGVTLTVKEGATTLVSPVLPFKTTSGQTDSTGNDVLSAVFALTAGAHSFVISGAGVNIDYLQLIKEDIQVGVDGALQRPDQFTLAQNYPNPFNPSTTINFTLGKASNVKLTVYNLLGQKVATLVDSRMNAGRQSVVFDASRYASGVYFYRLDAGSNFNSVKKMLLLK
jgi:hypothetical protein